MNNRSGVEGWKSSKANVFWGKIAPSDHVVQFYEDETVFLESLAGFVGDGINSGDSCIIIATPSHLHGLESRLTAHGIQVKDLVSEKRYFPMDAEKTLSSFMIDGKPDAFLFNKVVSALYEQSTANSRKVRAFGEMVALLWQKGQKEATIELENLWNKFCQTHPLCLFCAYSKNDFPGDIHSSAKHICGTHTKIISGSLQPMNQVIYSDLSVN